MTCPYEMVMIWDPIERFLWGIAILIGLMCGFYFINISRKREIFNEKIIMLGLASLPIGFALSSLFTFFQSFNIEGSFDGFTYCGVYTEEAPNLIYLTFAKLSYISFGIGGIFFVLAFDIIIKRSKYLFTLSFSIINIIEICSWDLESARFIFSFFLVPGLIILVPLVLFLYTRWSNLEFKAVSSFLMFGFILYMISLILTKRAHKMLNVYPLFLSPILLILACCITISPAIINPKRISHALPYWVAYIILTSPLLVIILAIDFFSEFNKIFFYEFLVVIIYIHIMYYFIIRDIRLQLIKVSELKHQYVEDEKSDFLKMFTRPQQVNFLASISHELRSPLTSIIGFTQTILKGRAGIINEEQEKQLKIILNSANHLNELITDVIDMTKIEANKFNVKKESFDLISELKDIVETFNLIINKKGLELYMDTPQKCIIHNDKKRINQILLNLIGNAIKFTEKGKISIKFQSKKNEITISVKDTGPGIKVEDLKKLFIPFSRIIEPGKVKEGVGLGLHLSKKLANLLGGDVLVKSKYGKGSTFKLVLKLEEE